MSMNSKLTVLSKLMAEENIEVIFGAYETASFDIVHRVLRFPVWEDADQDVYLWLLTHEIAHALYSTDRLLIDGRGFERDVNIIEDVRIEKLIQRKYPGLKMVYLRAGKKVFEGNFFSQQTYQNLDKLDVLDKINVMEKTRGYAKAKMSAYEQEIYDRVRATETEDDVISLVKELREKQKEGFDEIEIDLNIPLKDVGIEEIFEGEVFEKLVEKKVIECETYGGDLKEEQKEESGHDSEEQKEEDVAKTDYEFNLNVIQSAGKSRFRKQYFYSPDSETLVNDHVEPFDVYIRNIELMGKSIPSRPVSYNKFMKAVQPMVNAMVTEFNMRKSAEQSKRTRTHNTGRVNPLKLQNYKFSEDIFLSRQITADAESHGLVMLIDYSGSMVTSQKITDSNFAASTRAALILVAFCEKLNIPYEVYGFTDGYRRSRYNVDRNMIVPKNTKVWCILDSSAKKSDLHKAKVSLLYQTKDQKYIPHVYRFGMTPLNGAYLLMHAVIDVFKKKTRKSKPIFVSLTDGGCSSDNSVLYREGEILEHTSSRVYLNGGKHIVDVDTSKTISEEKYLETPRSFNPSDNDYMKAWIESMRDNLGAKTIHFYISPLEKYRVGKSLDSESGCGYEMKKETGGFDVKFLVSKEIMSLDVDDTTDGVDIENYGNIMQNRKDKTIITRAISKEIA
jgi:hypothetical protein